jgi:hypothetical protein
MVMRTDIGQRFDRQARDRHQFLRASLMNGKVLLFQECKSRKVITDLAERSKESSHFVLLLECDSMCHFRVAVSCQCVSDLQQKHIDGRCNDNTKSIVDLADTWTDSSELDEMTYDILKREKSVPGISRFVN